ncbi:MAG: endonuclease domain-containing protein [Balneolaceae bacterium]|nr:endonuclease domain-containing protein [Balneolaceae bacterium]
MVLNLSMADDQKHSAPLSRGRRAGGEDEKGKKSPKLPLHAGAEPHQFKYARQLRRDMTKAEKVLWEHLRARRFLNMKFRRQHPILEFIADFYCHKLKLIVEVDGEYHEEDDATYYDSERTKELKRYGYSVVRFSNERILKNIDEVLVELKELVTRLRKTSPQIPLQQERGFRGQSIDSAEIHITSQKSTPSPRGEGRERWKTEETKHEPNRPTGRI